MTFEIEGPRVSVADMFAAAARAGQASHSGLEQLRDSLNDWYGVELAHITRDTAAPYPYLLVRRGSTVSDVMVAVSITNVDQSPLYRLEAYTWPAWCCSGDAFVAAVRDTVYASRRWIERYLPLDPNF